MATDWVELFDLDLAKTVLDLDAAGLARFLEDRGPALAERDAIQTRQAIAERTARVAAYAKKLEQRLLAAGVPPAEAARQCGRVRDAGAGPEARERQEREVDWTVERWTDATRRLRAGDDLAVVRARVAWAAGKVSNPLHVDYWGCLAEVLLPLRVDETCETNLLIDPDDPDGEYAYFLLVPHVDAMIASLRAHWREVRVMDEAGLARLVEFRDRCASEAGLRVAYFIDF